MSNMSESFKTVGEIGKKICLFLHTYNGDEEEFKSELPKILEQIEKIFGSDKMISMPPFFTSEDNFVTKYRKSYDWCANVHNLLALRLQDEEIAKLKKRLTILERRKS